MKKFLTIMLIVFFSLGLFQKDVFAAGVSVSANKKQITIGSSFKVTVNASDCAATVSVSASNGSVSGGSGFIDMTSTSFTVTPSTTGTCTVTVSGKYAAYSGDSADVSYKKTVSVSVVEKASLTPTTPSQPSASPAKPQQKPTQTAPVQEDKRSKENTLTSLSISGGTLNPTFHASTTSYTVHLPADQTSVTIQAKAKDGQAKVTGTGEKNVRVGHNIFTITCTAENGSTKNYKIDAYVDETPLIYVEYGDRKLGVVRVLDEIKLPAGFEETKAMLNDQEVNAWMNEQLKITICYLQDEDNKKAFYVVEDGKVTYQLKQLQIDGRSFIVLPVEESMKKRDGFKWTQIKINDQEFEGWIYDDETMTAYSQIYLMNEKGEKCIYSYETTEQQLQKYTEPVEEEKVNVFMISTAVMTIAFIVMTGLLIREKRKYK